MEREERKLDVHSGVIVSKEEEQKRKKRVNDDQDKAMMTEWVTDG
jgi:hypothetical protein